MLGRRRWDGNSGREKDDILCTLLQAWIVTIWSFQLNDTKFDLIFLFFKSVEPSNLTLSSISLRSALEMELKKYSCNMWNFAIPSIAG